MALLTNSHRDAADHAVDRLPDAPVLVRPVTAERASLDAHVAAGGRVSEWLRERAVVTR